MTKCNYDSFMVKPDDSANLAQTTLNQDFNSDGIPAEAKVLNGNVVVAYSSECLEDKFYGEENLETFLAKKGFGKPNADQVKQFEQASWSKGTAVGL